MKVLYLQNTRGQHFDILEVMRSLSYEVNVENIPNEDEKLLSLLANKKRDDLLAKMTQNWDYIFTLDYYPTVANLCNTLQKIYVSWSLEPPFINLYSASVMHETNRIYVADKWLVDVMHEEGLNQFTYLCEGVNLERCNQVSSIVGAQRRRETSFFSNIEFDYWDRYFETDRLKDATLGYLDGLLAAQIGVFGKDLFAGSLPLYLLEDLSSHSPLTRPSDSVENIQSFYGQKVFYPRTSLVECAGIAKSLAKVSNLTFCGDRELTIEEVYLGEKSGEVRLGKEITNIVNMPYEEGLSVLGQSMIHVVMAPRGFKDGVYGKIMQAMAMGAVVVCDYKHALMDSLIPEELVIYFEDMVDLANKVMSLLKEEEKMAMISERAKEYAYANFDLKARIDFIEKNL